MLKTLTLCALVALGGANHAIAQEIAGRWSSLVCELRPGDQHLTRDITIREDGTWSGAFAFFTGPGCTDPFMTFHADGPWTELGPNDAINGAISADFTIASAEIEALHAGAAGFLNSAQCGEEAWSAGIRQTVTATGCAPLGMTFPVTEHELVLVRDGYLFFGARPNDGSGLSSPDARPTALQVPLVRQ